MSGTLSSVPDVAPEDARTRILDLAPAFASLDPAARHALASKGELVEIERRQPLYAGADRVIHVLASGRARSYRRAQGHALTVAHHGAGEIVGTWALAGTPSLEVVACERVSALRMPAESVLRAATEHGGFGVVLLRDALTREAELQARLHGLLTRTVESRVAQFLADSARRYGIPEGRGTLVGAKFTHQEIASYVGSTRETVTLVLGDLRRADLIDIDHRRIVIVDRAGLEARI